MPSGKLSPVEPEKLKLWIERFMEVHDLGQNAAARRLHLGPGYVSRIMSGELKGNLRYVTQKRVADSLGVSVNRLSWFVDNLQVPAPRGCSGVITQRPSKCFQ